MTLLEQKHLALLDEAQRRGQPGADNMRLCFEVLALASGIDRACAARLAPHRLSEGKFVLLLLLRDLPEGLAPHELAERAGAAYVKTSTGFSPTGFTVADLKLMRASVGPGVQVKAAHGIRTLATMLEVIDAGATRVGATATATILDDFQKRQGG